MLNKNASYLKARHIDYIGLPYWREQLSHMKPGQKQAFAALRMTLSGECNWRRAFKSLAPYSPHAFQMMYHKPLSHKSGDRITQSREVL